MHLTEVNAKMILDRNLADEFFRVFGREPADAISFAFAVWRDRSDFWPTIHNIRELIAQWKKERRAFEEEQSRAVERRAIEQGRREGKVIEWPHLIRKLNAVIALKPALPSVHVPGVGQMASLATCAVNLGADEEAIAFRRRRQKYQPLTPEMQSLKKAEALEQAKQLIAERGVKPYVAPVLSEEEIERRRKQLERDMQNADLEVRAERAKYDPDYAAS